MKSLNAIARDWYRARHRSRVVVLLVTLVACERYATTGVAGAHLYPINTDRAVITREGERLRIKVRKRERIARPTITPSRDTTWFDRTPNQNAAVASVLASSFRVLPGTEGVRSELAPDTAIVVAYGSGELRASGSAFSATAHLSGRVVQGDWYPLYRAANGYFLEARVLEPGGSRSYSSRRYCLHTSLWDAPPDQCMLNLASAPTNGFNTSTNTQLNIGTKCPFAADLNTHGRVAFYHNFLTDVNARDRRQTEVTDTKTADIQQRCFDELQQVCDDPSYCSPSDGGGDGAGGGSATVEGEVEWGFSDTSGGGFSDYLVCDVTDWYVWTGSSWQYTDTTIDSCWWERR